MQKVRFAQTLASVIMPCIGLICIFFYKDIAVVLPYTVGGGMLLYGMLTVTLRVKHAIKQSADPKRSDIGFVAAAIGASIILMGKSLSFVGTVWGLFGVWQSSASFHRGVLAIHERGKWALHFLLSAVRLGIALILLFDPEEKFAEHVIILGIDIIIDTFKLPYLNFKGIFSRISGEIKGKPAKETESCASAEAEKTEAAKAETI